MFDRSHEPSAPGPGRGEFVGRAAFPMKLRGGSAGWVRPVALVPESHFAGV
ncbi:MAG: hypothetical protein ACRDWV_09215 [Acidimicrobiales bacterium]